MTSQEKAIEIYNKFYGIPLYIKTIKECCNIMIDEILEMDYPHSELDDLANHLSYWEQVKEEIKKL
jgi:hypothetical protein